MKITIDLLDLSPEARSAIVAHVPLKDLLPKEVMDEIERRLEEAFAEVQGWAPSMRDTATSIAIKALGGNT